MNYTKKLVEWKITEPAKSKEIQNKIKEFNNNKDYEGLSTYLNNIAKELNND